MIAAHITVLLLAQAPQDLDIASPLPQDDLAAQAPVWDRSVSAHVGLNGGLLGLEWQHGRVMGFVSGAVAVPALMALTSNPFEHHAGGVAAGVGFTFPLSHPQPSMWFMDLFAEVIPYAWDTESFIKYVHVGIGAGVGLRYLHASGFTFAVKLPLLGAAVGGLDQLGFGSNPFEPSVALFYLYSLIAAPIISIGYRWDVR